MKNKTQKNLMNIAIILSIVVSIVFLGHEVRLFSLVGSSRSCNLGSFDITYFNPITSELKIDYNHIPIQTSGCLGVYDLTNIGTDAFPDNNSCIANGLAWRNTDQIPGSGGFQCYFPGNALDTGNGLLMNKNYTVTGGCTHTNPLFTDTYTPSFSGFQIDFADIKSHGDDTVYCSGSISIKPLSNPNGGGNSEKIDYTQFIIPILILIVAGYILFKFYKKRK